MKIFITFVAVSVLGLSANADERLYNKIQRKYDRDSVKGLQFAKKLKSKKSKEPDPYFFLAKHYAVLSEVHSSPQKRLIYTTRAASYARKVLKYGKSATYLSPQIDKLKEEIAINLKKYYDDFVDQEKYDDMEQIRLKYQRLTGVQLPTEEEIEEEKELKLFAELELLKVPRYIRRQYYGLPSGNERIDAYNAEFEKEVLRILNKARIAKGLNPVRWDNSLNYSARYHAYDMANQNYFSHSTHDSVDGKLFKIGGAFQRIGKFYTSDGRPNGENIAAGSKLPMDTYLQWFHSPGHYAIMFNPATTHIGVGLHYNPYSTYSYYWVMCTARG